MAAPEISSSSSAKTYGRGGAGNINSRPTAQLQSSDLQTPTIKSSTFTTGRGGAGNMANANSTAPEEARLRQDVEAPKAHGKELEGTYHWGRGGQGNMTTLVRTQSGVAAGEGDNLNTTSNKSGNRSGSFGGIVNKGRELLGLKKDYNNKVAQESAVE